MNQTHAFCPCCNFKKNKCFTSLSVTTLVGNIKMPLFRCSICKHAWLDTGNSHKIIEDEYSNDYIGHRIDSYFEFQCRKTIINEIAPLISPPATLLDVGCGNGGFLLAAQELGYNSLGVDISKQAVEIVNNRGGKAMEVDFLSYNFDHSFDVITMWDVVEHLKDPFIFFKRAKQLLNPKGILIIKTPSVGIVPLYMAKCNNDLAGALLQAPHHVQYWTQKSIDALFDRSGFGEIIHWKPRKFRSEPETKSIQKKIRRKIRNTILHFTASENLYCAARIL
jgi:2-polyprenyl-3-methyl-5-hydroxy-6-metoxy-1,4-benzoquinol methylase